MSSFIGHIETITVQYARWDLTQISLIDSHNNTLLCRIYPLDKAENASGKRRGLAKDNHQDDLSTSPEGIAPLLKKLMANYAATGLPPAYIPKDDIIMDQLGEKQ